MRPSPASCSESSSATTPRSRSTTARPSPRYTAARRAERCSFESISLCVLLRCQAQAVAHHPRRERRRLASASPVSCAGAGSVEVTGADVQAPQYAETPRPSRPSPAPTLAAQLETGDPAATHLSAFTEAMGPLPVHVSEATPAGRCARSGRRGREPAVVCQQPPVVRSPQSGRSPAVTATRSGATIATVAKERRAAPRRRLLLFARCDHADGRARTIAPGTEEPADAVEKQ